MSVRLEGDATGVRTLTLDRPPVNALGRELVEEISRACGALREDAGARCLVVRSAGKHFCGGADLKERQGMSLEDGARSCRGLLVLHGTREPPDLDDRRGLAAQRWAEGSSWRSRAITGSPRRMRRSACARSRSRSCPALAGRSACRA
jgi:enoyl-CoA hydratase/carnithine racemase